MSTVRYRTAFLLLVVLAALPANAQDAAAAASGPSDAEVYFMPFSHLDFYWGGTREECLARGNEVASLHYPPPGTYVFRYSLSSASGDWKASKAYRAGMGCNNPLLPVSVVDAISAKSLPPTYSFASVKQDSVVLSALKKSDLGPSLLLRVYEIEGSALQTPVEFLGRTQAFGEVNLLEEDLDSTPRQVLRGSPYSIKTLKLNIR